MFFICFSHVFAPPTALRQDAGGQPAQHEPSQPERGDHVTVPRPPPTPPRVTEMRYHNKKMVSLFYVSLRMLGLKSCISRVWGVEDWD